MKSIRLILAAVVCLALTPAAHAGTVAGNPDQRSSLLLTMGYGSGLARSYQSVGGNDDRLLGEQEYAPVLFSGVATFPATSGLSFVLGFSRTTKPPPNRVSAGDIYQKDRVNLATLSIRLYLP